VICLSKPDNALIARYQSDDVSAFDEIVSRYKQKIYQYVFRMVGDADEAEDLTQEVFVKTYLSLASFRNQSSLNTWLYRIAGNLCIDNHRKRTRKEIALGGNVASLDDGYYGDSAGSSDDSRQSREVPDATNEPYQVLARQELDAQIQTALTKLPDKMRSVIVLHDLEGLPYEEIAAIVKCPLGTVKSRLFNARQQIKELLKGYMEG
jgi:RNA polymerase sigma-70 factor (ECF subfamily)